ncbi:MAG: PTS system fructose-specific EIIABC component [Smithella sp. PtaU1.Bin162]|nr:MAG: PTS system fructose-specific EIIABC component [Smithella sp. PtaU1.Bin162]
MRLDHILKMEFLNDDLQARTKTEVLAELSEMIVNGFPKLDQSKIIDVLQQREKLGSTGIGDGVAIPHGKIGALEEVAVAFGRSKNGVAFDSMDGKPVYLFFLLLAPEDCASQHLKALAKISKMLKAGNFRKDLMEAKSKAELYEIIIQQDEACPA